jgi:hypothetical protein
LTDFTAERLANQCRRFAEKEGRGYSPIYEHLASRLANDDELLDWLARTGDALRVPINLFAAVHYLARRDPDGALARLYRGEPGDLWSTFRTFVDDHHAEIGELLISRTIQTNEVGRSAVLVPAMCAVAERFEHRPLALVEIGPSAGLNLFLDRYAVQYSDGRTTGPSDSPVHLRCEIVGATPPLPDGSGLAITSRVGIDLAPVDVRDADAIAWLEACIWPDVPDRLERFRAAVRLARADAPTIRRGDAVDLLVPTIEHVPDAQLPIVFATWALAYLPAERRERIHDLLAEVGGQRDLAFVTAEFPQVTPWYPESPAPTLTGRGATLLGATVWSHGVEQAMPLAWTHAHGQWLDWFGAAA